MKDIKKSLEETSFEHHQKEMNENLGMIIFRKLFGGLISLGGLLIAIFQIPFLGIDMASGAQAGYVALLGMAILLCGIYLIERNSFTIKNLLHSIIATSYIFLVGIFLRNWISVEVHNYNILNIIVALALFTYLMSNVILEEFSEVDPNNEYYQEK